MNNPDVLDVMRAEIDDLRGRMIATEFAIKTLMAQRLDWKAVQQSWQRELSSMVDTMTEGALSPHERTAMLDERGRFSVGVPVIPSRSSYALNAHLAPGLRTGRPFFMLFRRVPSLRPHGPVAPGSWRQRLTSKRRQPQLSETPLRLPAATASRGISSSGAPR